MGLQDRTPTSVEEYASYKTRFSNWGRWGEDDQLGTLNHITDDRVKYAASLKLDFISFCNGTYSSASFVVILFIAWFFTFTLTFIG